MFLFPLIFVFAILYYDYFYLVLFKLWTAVGAKHVDL